MLVTHTAPTLLSCRLIPMWLKAYVHLLNPISGLLVVDSR